MNTPEPRQQQIGRAMLYIGWLLAIGLLTLLFDGLLTRWDNPNADPDTRTSAAGMQEVVLQRNRGGHYVATGAINGQPVTFLLDTGASDVSVPARLADRLGLRPGPPQQSLTANGTITVYASVADEVTLGHIVRRRVRASINPHMNDDTVLLGMSFMQDLELVQRGNTLTLRQY